MSIFAAVLLGLVMGALFGLALEKSKVMNPAVLVEQFRFKNFTMLKMFLSAVAVGLVILSALLALDLASLHPKALNVGPVVVGGLIMGVGMAIAAACPGTVMAQIGAGYRDSIGVLLGGIVGAVTYGYTKGWWGNLLAGFGDYGKLTLPELWQMPYWVLAIGLAVVLVIALAVLEKYRPWQEETPTDES